MSSSVDNIEFPTDLNVDEIQNLFNEYIRYGLKFIWKIEIPDKLKDVAETIQETNRHMSSPLKS